MFRFLRNFTSKVESKQSDHFIKNVTGQQQSKISTIFWTVAAFALALFLMENSNSVVIAKPSDIFQSFWIYQREYIEGLSVSAMHVMVAFIATHYVGYTLGNWIVLMGPASGTLTNFVYTVMGTPRYAILVYMGIAMSEMIVLPGIGYSVYDYRADLYCFIVASAYSIEYGRKDAWALLRTDDGKASQLLMEIVALGCTSRWTVFSSFIWPLLRYHRINTTIHTLSLVWLGLMYIEPILEPRGNGFGSLASASVGEYADFSLFFGCVILFILVTISMSRALRYFQQSDAVVATKIRCWL